MFLQWDKKIQNFYQIEKEKEFMKLHISYNFADLDRALALAEQTAPYADILGVGSLLIVKYGVHAIKAFRTAFPNKELFAELHIVEKGEESVTMMAQAGANYVSVLAGAHLSTIKKAVEAAKQFDIKIALDLLDAQSVGQSALDAKTIGAHMIILQRYHAEQREEDANQIENGWRDVKDNTNLPIFVTGKIDDQTIEQIIKLKPQGIMIGTAITKADNPAQKASYFKSRM